MKRFVVVGGVLLALAAAAQPEFRQKVREVSGGYHVWLLTDGGVVSALDCAAGHQELTDGGTWPLKHSSAMADGGAVGPTVDACVRLLEGRNGLDGGLQ